MNDQLSLADLEEIRAAAIEHFERGSHEFRAAFLHELKSGFAHVSPSETSIGQWIVGEHEGGLVLKREPPPAGVMYHFGVYLRKVAARWVVAGDFVEREITDIEP